MDMAASATAEPHPALALLARETRVRRASLAREFAGVALAEGSWIMTDETILLRAQEGIRLRYRRGEGVVLDAPGDADPRDISLWLDGVIYAAVAAINGLMPLHASAVVHGGRVHAFSGPPGAGKSTLAAALGRRGMPLMCDDTLILDISDPTHIVCLPGHKRLKLWPDGAALADAAMREQVARDFPKYFADPPAGVAGKPLPLAELVFLETGEEPSLTPIAPGGRIACLVDEHYTAQMFARAGGSRGEHFARIAAIAAHVPMWRFARPWAADRFDRTLAIMDRHVRTGETA